MNEREEMKVTCIEPDQQALVTLANIEYRISVHSKAPTAKFWPWAAVWWRPRKPGLCRTASGRNGCGATPA